MIGGILRAHSVARELKKPPYFFSRFKFERMKERCNTHFCFHCYSDVGFTPGLNQEPTNHIGENGSKWMQKHDGTHLSGVVGNADKYDNPWDWLEAEVPSNFPYLIAIPAIN